MRIHLISIGGAAMHNIAIALKKNGHEVSGSDDEIYEPSKTRLKDEGLLPSSMGWNENRITKDIDLILLGMHARVGNPELDKAIALGIKVMSFPEYIYAHAQHKKRVVITGSHGKTTTSSMIMHVMRNMSLDFDYLVGAQIQDFETMARFSDAPIMIIEGDEYLSSAIDRRPKMLHYKPDIAVMTGIEWDHINVFPSFKDYVIQFDKLIDSIEEGGSLIYYKDDDEVSMLASKARKQSLELIPYEGLKKDNKGNIKIGKKAFSTKLFGQHNMENMEAAYIVCKKLGVRTDDFFASMSSFKGAQKRLQLLYSSPAQNIYLDFAHAPSKVTATVKAVIEEYKNTPVTAFLELHTFSSLNTKFLAHYKESMNGLAKAYVFVDPHIIEMKKMKPIPESLIKESFQNDQLVYLSSRTELALALQSCKADPTILLMSSGKFGELNLIDSLNNQ